MYLKSLEIAGFKSFAKKSELAFTKSISAIVGPNGSGKSNIAEAFRFALGEQSMKSLRGKRGEDLIFNGSNEVPRANRAAVKLVFDNSKRFLPIDFDEVSIERVVHRDSENEYFINGSPVRLKDIIEMMTSAHIGPSGHHIISQGEADKILNANPKERRTMVEDALGLKLYQYKKQESQKKLAKTLENMDRVEDLRKEVAPHLRFLKKQVEKVEKSFALKEELKQDYLEYLKTEEVFLEQERRDILDKRKPLLERKEETEKEISRIKSILSESKENQETSSEIIALDEALRKVRHEKDEFMRDIGRLEGEIAAEERIIQRQKELHSTDAGKRIPLTEVLKVSEDVVSEIDEALSRKELEVYEQAFNNVKKVITEFTLRHKTFVDESVETEAKGRIETLLNKKAEIEKEIVVRKENEQSLLEHSLEIKKNLENKKDQSRDAERELFSFMNNLNELERSISDLRNKENTLIILEEEFKREVGEAAVLIGRAVLEYKSFDLSSVSESTREKQHDLRKNIERKKLRIEEAGASGGDEIMKEYKEVSERDSFLERELIDLKATSENLTQIINELDIKLTTEFKSGIDTINKEFSKYFEIMFGGGHAKLVIVKEVKKRKAAADADDEVGDVADTVSDSEATLDVADAAFDAEGVDIEVSLPRKKIKGLVMLSGGERALTSIALIFAVSQVNPPPFIILDETDAALDEANSRKYGDMIENLAAYSQLILITHNRETMSRASTIYGVTMGLGGASKLLSIEFDEAVSVAK